MTSLACHLRRRLNKSLLLHADAYSEIGPVFQPPAVGPPSIAHLGLAINVRSLDGPSV
jgi:hypothetical protein